MLFDIRPIAVVDELCDLFGVPDRCLPEVATVVSGRFGVTTAGLALTGAGIPISGIAGDQQAALFGQACFAPGADQEHLRHRFVRAHERRARRVPTRSTGC